MYQHTDLQHIRQQLQTICGSKVVSNDSNVSISILTRDEVQLVKVIWQSLESETRDVSLTNKWGWVETWLEQYRDVIDFWFVVGMHLGQFCGIVLLTKETHRLLPLPVNAFHFGTNGEPYKDAVQMIHNAILVKPELRQQFFEKMIHAVMNQFDWEELVFDEYDQNAAELLIASLSKHPHRIKVQKQTCRYFDLATIKQADSSVLGHFSKSTKYSIRRSLKVFQDDIHVEWAESVDQALDILDELQVLYTKTWGKFGKRGMFDSKRFRNFQLSVIKKLFDQGSIILFRATSKQYGTLGCLYLFVDNGVAYGYQLGMNDFADVDFQTINKKRLRTGFIVHTLCMQECLKRGIKAYNFSIGEYPYKREMTNAEEDVVTVSIRRTIKPLIRDRIVALYSKIHEQNRSSSLIKLVQRFT